MNETTAFAIDFALGKLLVTTRRARHALSNGASEADLFAWEAGLTAAAIAFRDTYRSLPASEQGVVENTAREAMDAARALASELWDAREAAQARAREESR